MRVVLDTKVLVSGLITGSGTCARALDLAIEGYLVPCTDARLLAEYEAVLGRPELAIDPRDAETLGEFLRSFSVGVVAPPLDVRLPDPADLPFLEVASAAGAVLVTGNSRHFPARSCRTVVVVTPRGMLDLLRS